MDDDLPTIPEDDDYQETDYKDSQLDQLMRKMEHERQLEDEQMALMTTHKVHQPATAETVEEEKPLPPMIAQAIQSTIPVEPVIVQPPPPDEDKRDRLKGLLWGAALGDALGAPYEFRYGTVAYNDYLVQTQGRELGQVSDDTEMMLALAYALADGNGWNRELVVTEYCKWATSDCPDIGKNTAALFGHKFAHTNTIAQFAPQHPQQPLTNNINIQQVNSYDAMFNTLVLTQPQFRWSQSNGCLMRCMPLVVLPPEEKKWRLDCVLSNPHPICMESSDFYFAMLNSMIDGSFKCKFPTAINPEIKEVIQQAKKDIPRDVTNNRGWVCHALYMAIVCYKTPFKTFTEGMRFVIGAHMNSDTDTNACIAGAVLGCKLGFNKMMECPITKQNIQTMKESRPLRPVKYHPINIDGLVDRLLKVGTVQAPVMPISQPGVMLPPIQQAQQPQSNLMPHQLNQQSQQQQQSQYPGQMLPPMQSQQQPVQQQVPWYVQYQQQQQLQQLPQQLQQVYQPQQPQAANVPFIPCSN